ncbi:MAG: hypothetical protein LBS92_06435 [Candidatus Methanoplasma sp.]|jgi:hypothetical protein|nr:hypothetical protein [Candidatus Methanoplasma sp.]
MRKCTFVLALALVAVTLIGAMEASDIGNALENQSASLDSGYALENTDVFTSSNVVIITNAADTRASGEKSNVKIQPSFDSISGLDIVLIDGSWAKSADSEYVADNVSALVESSHPVLLLDNNPGVLTENLTVSHSFSTEADVYGFFYDNNTGVSYCNSVIGKDLNDSLSKQYAWAKEKSDGYLAMGVTPTITNSSSETWVLKTQSAASATTGNFGQANVNTYYYALQ